MQNTKSIHNGLAIFAATVVAVAMDVLDAIADMVPAMSAMDAVPVAALASVEWGADCISSNAVLAHGDAVEWARLCAKDCHHADIVVSVVDDGGAEVCRLAYDRDGGAYDVSPVTYTCRHDGTTEWGTVHVPVKPGCIPAQATVRDIMWVHFGVQDVRRAWTADYTIHGSGFYRTGHVHFGCGYVYAATANEFGHRDVFKFELY